MSDVFHGIGKLCESLKFWILLHGTWWNC